MKISIIVAVSENNVIGKRNKMPWYIPLDLKHFKEITMGHHILMGRKTYESIGKALPGRTSLIVTRNKNSEAKDCFIFENIQNAIDFAKSKKEEELFVIGGSEIYNQVLSKTQKIYMTKIHDNIDGDVYFPELNSGEWKEENIEEHKEITPPISFITLSRI